MFNSSIIIWNFMSHIALSQCRARNEGKIRQWKANHFNLVKMQRSPNFPMNFEL